MRAVCSYRLPVDQYSRNKNNRRRFYNAAYGTTLQTIWQAISTGHYTRRTTGTRAHLKLHSLNTYLPSQPRLELISQRWTKHVFLWHFLKSYGVRHHRMKVQLCLTKNSDGLNWMYQLYSWKTNASFEFIIR